MSKKSIDPRAEMPEENIPKPETEIPEIPETPAEPQTLSAEDELQLEKEKYLRLYAEYDNFRKRSQKERESLFSTVRADTILQLLPVYDNLERALSLKSSDEAFYKGIEMTMVQLQEILLKLGVTPIEAVGQKFDANIHNAVMHVDDDSKGESEIVEEYQKGFKMGDKVIRFSVVKVAN